MGSVSYMIKVVNGNSKLPPITVTKVWPDFCQMLLFVAAVVAAAAGREFCAVRITGSDNCGVSYILREGVSPARRCCTA